MLGIVGKTLKKLVVLSALCVGSTAFAGGKTFLVIGVIASAEPGQGIALLKSGGNGEAFAARVGQEIDREVTITRITREYVYLQVKGRMDKVKVGEQVDTSFSSADAATAMFDEANSGIERKGNAVRISAAFREHMVKEQLSKVLMQAAAVPYYVNGQLAGFRLWDLDPGSVYEKAGFINGDIITSINGQALTDVGMTIRMLQTLKNEPKVDVAFTRGGAAQTITIEIQ